MTSGIGPILTTDGLLLSFCQIVKPSVTEKYKIHVYVGESSCIEEGWGKALNSMRKTALTVSCFKVLMWVISSFPAHFAVYDRLVVAMKHHGAPSECEALEYSIISSYVRPRIHGLCAPRVSILPPLVAAS